MSKRRRLPNLSETQMDHEALMIQRIGRALRGDGAAVTRISLCRQMAERLEVESYPLGRLDQVRRHMGTVNCPVHAMLWDHRARTFEFADRDENLLVTNSRFVTDVRGGLQEAEVGLVRLATAKHPKQLPMVVQNISDRDVRSHKLYQELHAMAEAKDNTIKILLRRVGKTLRGELT